ncbi:unnamed protein product [marine sediment metagenome]|uniref:Uncharacterized protein n=1 Tax=marine sediment metagenome TaxID=412755 RepID=X1IN43_9ZZZZ
MKIGIIQAIILPVRLFMEKNNVKKKVVALANSDLHKLATTLIKK